MVLDLTSGRLSDAIIHVQKALESVESRLAELRDGLAGQLPPLPPQKADNDDNTKGKSKSSGRLVRDDYVQNMSKTQIENEIKELNGLRDDLELKVSWAKRLFRRCSMFDIALTILSAQVEELKTSPNESLTTSAPALVAQALDRELNAGPSTSNTKTTVVNDLTSMVVKKKKKVPEDSNAVKRKADEEAEPLTIDKKPKLESADQ